LYHIPTRRLATVNDLSSRTSLRHSRYEWVRWL